MNNTSQTGNVAWLGAIQQVMVNGDPRSVFEFGIAVDDASSIGEAGFFTVRIWGPYAQVQAENIYKGRRVAISGRLQQDRWVADNGENRSKVVILATEVEWLTWPNDKDE